VNDSIGELRCYGLTVIVSCPACKKVLPMANIYSLPTKDYGEAFLQNVARLAMEHRRIFCDPSANWTPEQLGYFHDAS